MRPLCRPPAAGRERGSTLPLILGFTVVGFVAIAGIVAAGDAFVQQRGLQDVCDGAAAEAAASAISVERGTGLGAGDTVAFIQLQQSISSYLSRDPSREQVRVRTRLEQDRQTVTLVCTETRSITFGAMFGQGDGVRHRVTSSAQAPLN
jgi:hypothetical protein